MAVFPAALLIACSVPEVDAKAEACIEQVAGMTGQAEDAGTASQIRSDLSGATTYSVSMANSAYTCQVGPNGEVLSVQSM